MGLSTIFVVGRSSKVSTPDRRGSIRVNQSQSTLWLLYICISQGKGERKVVRSLSPYPHLFAHNNLLIAYPYTNTV